MNKVIPTKEELKKYYFLGFSMKEIADYLNMSVGKIYKYFVVYGIKPRKHLNKMAKNKISLANKGNSYALGSKRTEEQKENIRISKSKGIGGKKISSEGYIRIYFPDHPKSDKRGFLSEHDLIMECYIGRWLKSDEVVHHKNKNKTDNRIENLCLMKRDEHSKLHRLEKLGRSDDLSIKYF